MGRPKRHLYFEGEAFCGKQPQIRAALSLTDQALKVTCKDCQTQYGKWGVSR